MQWWCSAQTAAWDWGWQMYPGVWAFIVMLVAVYWVLQHRATTASATGSRVAVFLFGVLLLWIALDWPIGALGAGYLASAHMVQFLLIAVAVPPLLLHGLPPYAFEALTRRRLLLSFLRPLTHPLVALAFFNVVLVATHWPSVVDSLMSSQIGSFTLDMAWWVAGLVLWWPIVAPVPRRPGFSYLYKIGYLILATILNTPAFAWLTFSDLPLYATYELAPPVTGMSTRADQQIAGLLMKIGGALIFWTAITVLFVRWYQEESGEEAHA
jgi:putative membrane protein